MGAYENLDEGDNADEEVNHVNIEDVEGDQGLPERVQPGLDEDLESEEDEFAELDAAFHFQNIRATTPPTSSESSSSGSSSSSSSGSSWTDDNHNQQPQGRLDSSDDEGEDEDEDDSQDEDTEAQAYVAEFFEGYQL